MPVILDLGGVEVPCAGSIAFQPTKTRTHAGRLDWIALITPGALKKSPDVGGDVDSHRSRTRGRSERERCRAHRAADQEAKPARAPRSTGAATRRGVPRRRRTFTHQRPAPMAMPASRWSRARSCRARECPADLRSMMCKPAGRRRTSASGLLSLKPAGLADGLALKEQRYRGISARFAPTTWVPGSPASSQGFGMRGQPSTGPRPLRREHREIHAKCDRRADDLRP